MYVKLSLSLHVPSIHIISIPIPLTTLPVDHHSPPYQSISSLSIFPLPKWASTAPLYHCYRATLYFKQGSGETYLKMLLRPLTTIITCIYGNTQQHHSEGTHPFQGCHLSLMVDQFIPRGDQLRLNDGF